MTSRATVFVATKPLQILTAINIAQQSDPLNSNTIIVAGGFSEARTVLGRLSREQIGFHRHFYVSNRKDLLHHLSKTRYDDFFIDGDVGIRNLKLLIDVKIRQPKINLCVFEEGLGTYREDIYPSFKRKIFDLLGIGSHFGGCLFTSRVYVYDSELYRSRFPAKSRKVRRIARPLSQLITENRDSLRRIFNSDKLVFPVSNNGRCYVYLSSWNVHRSFLQDFNKLDGAKFIKLHPAIQSQPLDLSFNEDTVLVPNYVPAELLAEELEKKYGEILFFHEGSSADRYISSERIQFARLPAAP